MNRPRWIRPMPPLPFVLCGGLLLGGMLTAGPAAALTPVAPSAFDMPVPPAGFNGPGGCTSATAEGAMLCLWVDQDNGRPPLFIKTVRGTFSAPDSSTVHACDYELSYYRDGVQRTDRHLNFGCEQADSLPDSEDFPLQDQLDVDKPICVRITTTQAREDWTRPTCVTIRRDSSDVGNT